ncbi:nuclear transport factor 2 family protein [Lentzea kentuckyensis]|uniref:nuclear transport factor 2 family protein n=1 Tax=Lentzea kentuckyensis TaxID=360086 RepID=UPI000A3ACB8A|nr:nuclear transport factor 2 family protein [Lentzea kentuckyensis]
MAQSNEPLDVARKYFEALSAKDFAAVAGMFADDIVWHQPGANQFSGTRRGGEAVGEMLGGMMSVSQGTFEISLTGPLAANGSIVAAPIRFGGMRDGATVDQDGIDLLRVEGDRIAEVWLFSSDPVEEDAFWGAA